MPDFYDMERFFLLFSNMRSGAEAANQELSERSRRSGGLPRTDYGVHELQHTGLIFFLCESCLLKICAIILSGF